MEEKQPKKKCKVEEATCIVVYQDDDGVDVMEIPCSVLETAEAQEVLDAIVGKDLRYCPYTGSKPELEKNASFIAKVKATLADWQLSYAVSPLLKTDKLVVGSGYV